MQHLMILDDINHNVMFERMESTMDIKGPSASQEIPWHRVDVGLSNLGNCLPEMYIRMAQN